MIHTEVYLWGTRERDAAAIKMERRPGLPDRFGTGLLNRWFAETSRYLYV